MWDKVFRHVETLFVQGRNLYLAGLLLIVQGLFTSRQPIAGLQGTGFYLGRIKFPDVERPYSWCHYFLADWRRRRWSFLRLRSKKKLTGSEMKRKCWWTNHWKPMKIYYHRNQSNQLAISYFTRIVLRWAFFRLFFFFILSTDKVLQKPTKPISYFLFYTHSTEVSFFSTIYFTSTIYQKI